MLLFLALFLSVYGCYHLYFYFKLKQAFPLLLSQEKITLGMILTLLCLAPILCRIAERTHHETLAYFLALFGFIWMAFIFEFFCLGLLIDLFRIVIHAVWKKSICSPRSVFYKTTILSTTLCIYGAFEANAIRVNTIHLQTIKIPPESQKLTIAQISDVHLGLLAGKKKLEKILQIIKEIQPDILVSTGDLLDGQGKEFKEMAPMFRALQPAFGKYSVTGNHERYTGLETSQAFFREAGFILLDHSQISPQPFLTIIGEGEPLPHRFRQEKPPYNSILAAANPHSFILFLKHRPIVNNQDAKKFDLQLSGHTHQGQLFPFNFITKLFFPWPNGELVSILENHDKSSLIYVSRGTGAWGPPIRIFAPPEITIFSLEPIVK